MTDMTPNQEQDPNPENKKKPQTKKNKVYFFLLKLLGALGLIVSVIVVSGLAISTIGFVVLFISCANGGGGLFR